MTPPISQARVPTGDEAPCPGRGQKIRWLLRRSHEERASGGRARRELAPAPEQIGRGDALVVAPIDRIARSLPHLLEAVERLEAKCTVIPSLQDLIDAGRVAGSGCAAEFARALIRERTKAGLASAPAKGRVGGNPGLRARDPAELRKARLARQDGYMECLNEMAQDCVVHVSRLRPDMAWEDVVRIVNGPLPREREWTQSRLPRAMNAYVRDGFLPENVLGRAGRRETDDRLPVIASPSAPFRPSATGWRLCGEHIPQPDELTVVTRCCWNGPRGRT